jgi:hypothetical protein
LSIHQTDAEAAAVAVAPRVSLDSIEAKIGARYDFTGEEALEGRGVPIVPGLKLLSICILVMENGFTVIGMSAPASPENFNAELGKKFAYEDAIRQLWPLEGYMLRQRLYEGVGPLAA